MSSFENFYYRNIALKIREYRLKMGLTQEQLSEMLNKNIKYIGHVERCERKISNKMLVRLLLIFKVQPKVFFNFNHDYCWE